MWNFWSNGVRERSLSDMEFDYYYGSQADQFSFIRIPRMLLTEETFFINTAVQDAVFGTSGPNVLIYEEWLV